MRVRTASLVLAGITVLAVPGARAVPVSDSAVREGAANAPITSALGALKDLENQTEKLRRDVRTLRFRGDRPEALEARVKRLELQIGAVLFSLRGQRWFETEPVLRRAERLRGRLAHLRERLAAPAPERSLTRGRSEAARAVASGTGRITGRVADAQTGTLLESYVYVYDVDGYAVGSWSTSSGVYVADGLATGTYFVRATDTSGDHIAELYDDIPCPSYCEPTSGTPIAVTDGQTAAGIDFALTSYSRIKGVVVDAASSLPLEDTEVTVYDSAGGWVGSSYGGTDGTYELGRLTQGVYFVVAASDRYLDQVFNGIPCQPDCSPQSGTPILVGPAAVVSGIDFRLQLGGSVSGHVRDLQSGEPISNDWVELYDSQGRFVDYANTGPAGSFQVFDLPSGDYFAITESWYGEYADQLYDGIPCEPTCVPTSGTPIAVTQGQEHSGVDFALQRFGSFSGTVTDAATGLPIPDVRVDVVDAQGRWMKEVGTDATGWFRAGGLSDGTYFAYTISKPYVDQLYDGRPCEPSCTPTEGTPIPVTIANETKGVNFALELGGWISGTVMAQVGGAPLEDAEVSVYAAGGVLVDEEWSNGAGQYRVVGLVTGSYYAVGESYETLAELYRELPCPSGCDPTAGTPIPVTTSQGTTGIDFTLSRFGRIVGRVTDAASGLPLSPTVVVYSSTGSLLSSAYPDATGAYVLDGLQSGNYFLRTVSYGNWIDQLYLGRICEPDCDVTQGTPVPVALDTATSGIDFALRRSTFADVPVTHWAWKWVEAVYAAGITAGCGTSPLRFCPDASVTRGQTSIFLLRAKEGSSYVPPPCGTTPLFGDVPVTSPYCGWVEELSRRGVVSGCAPNLFCPAASAARTQMAPFLRRTREGSGYTPPDPIGIFQDVPTSSPYARWIEELVRRAITSGCSTNPSLYCPGTPVNRAQLAVFLTRTFGLALP